MLVLQHLFELEAGTKVAGYLRIYDKQAKSYCLLDGTPSRDPEKTHFKIKRREEM